MEMWKILAKLQSSMSLIPRVPFSILHNVQEVICIPCSATSDASCFCDIDRLVRIVLIFDPTMFFFESSQLISFCIYITPYRFNDCWLQRCRSIEKLDLSKRQNNTAKCYLLRKLG